MNYSTLKNKIQRWVDNNEYRPLIQIALILSAGLGTVIAIPMLFVGEITPIQGSLYIGGLAFAGGLYYDELCPKREEVHPSVVISCYFVGMVFGVTGITPLINSEFLYFIITVNLTLVMLAILAGWYWYSYFILDDRNELIDFLFPHFVKPEAFDKNRKLQ